jgi:hypothetical protein
MDATTDSPNDKSGGREFHIVRIPSGERNGIRAQHVTTLFSEGGIGGEIPRPWSGTTIRLETDKVENTQDVCKKRLANELRVWLIVRELAFGSDEILGRNGEFFVVTILAVASERIRISRVKNTWSSDP